MPLETATESILAHFSDNSVVMNIPIRIDCHAISPIPAAHNLLIRAGQNESCGSCFILAHATSNGVVPRYTTSAHPIY